MATEDGRRTDSDGLSLPDDGDTILSAAFSDTDDLEKIGRRIRVQDAGNVSIVPAGNPNKVLTYKNCGAGSYIDMNVRRIRLTDTTVAEVIVEY